MQTRSWSLYCFLLILVSSCFSVAIAQERIAPNPFEPDINTVCRPVAACEPCPADALKEPFCQPFGNRRLMHCFASSDPDAQHAGKEGETPAWQSCGRIVARERADFWEFIACNVLFAAAALSLVVVRSKRLHAMQARQLAARIGLGRTGIV